MAAIDFPNPPLTVGQNFSAPNGFTYQWDGAVWTAAPAVNGVAAGGDLTGVYPNPSLVPAQKNLWTVSGVAVTPLDATKTLILQGQGDPNAVVMSRRAAKSRLIANPVNDAHYWTANDALNPAGSAWVQDVASLPSWIADFDLNADAFYIYRGGANGAALAPVMSIENGGQYVYLGTTRPRPMIQAYAGSAALHANFAWGPDDMTMPSWTVYPRPDVDQFVIYRRAPNAAAGSVTAPLYISSDGLTHCSLARQLVNQISVSSGSFGTLNTWMQVAATGAVNIASNNSLVLITCCIPMLAYVGNATTYQAVGWDGAARVGFKQTWGTSFMTPMITWMTQGLAGSHTFSFWVYTSNGAYAPMGDSQGYIQVAEFQ